MKLAFLRAIALITPARIASGATPAERRLIASDSANTVAHTRDGVLRDIFGTVELLDAGVSVREITSKRRCRRFVIHRNRTGYRHHQAESLAVITDVDTARVAGASRAPSP